MARKRGINMTAIKIKPLEFPSWEELEKNQRFHRWLRDYEYWMMLVVSTIGREYIDFGVKKHGQEIWAKVSDYTEAGYALAIAQLNTWLTELITDLSGGAE